MVNCHPTLMLQVATRMGVDANKRVALHEYVHNRDIVLQRISEYYGVTPTKAKMLVLRVLNGGSMVAWVNDPTTGCTRNMEEPQPDVRELEHEGRAVRDAFFAMPEFEQHVERLREEMTATQAAKVHAAEERVMAAQSASARTRAQTELGNARRKRSRHAIDRSVFSACMFDLEDRVLQQIKRHFNDNGWIVSSMQFDGLHVEHDPEDRLDDWDDKWILLEEAMRGAEEAVEKNLGYDIKLKEKALFQTER
jgi:hypothetical protein